RSGRSWPSTPARAAAWTCPTLPQPTRAVSTACTTPPPEMPPVPFTPLADPARRGAPFGAGREPAPHDRSSADPATPVKKSGLMGSGDQGTPGGRVRSQASAGRRRHRGGGGPGKGRAADQRKAGGGAEPGGHSIRLDGQEAQVQLGVPQMDGEP